MRNTTTAPAAAPTTVHTPRGMYFIIHTHATSRNGAKISTQATRKPFAPHVAPDNTTDIATTSWSTPNGDHGPPKHPKATEKALSLLDLEQQQRSVLSLLFDHGHRLGLKLVTLDLQLRNKARDTTSGGEQLRKIVPYKSLRANAPREPVLNSKHGGRQRSAGCLRDFGEAHYAPRLLLDVPSSASILG